CVRIRAESGSREAAAYAVERMRFALGVDHDLGDFHRAFKRDPLLGPVIRRRPWIRPLRRPEPFEALAWAITEQLIEAEREACDLAGKRAIAMVRVAREVASGRADLTQHEPTWRRLRTIREIGSWTIDKLA